MKNRYILVASLLLSNFFAKAQKTSSTDSIRVNQTEVELVYNHYTQNGDNSPITGGIGTERLTVYGPSVNVKKTFGENAISFQLGADIISSASTDNIDFVKSSASILDTRSYGNINYIRTLGKNKLTLNAGIGASIESDYFSFAKYLGISKTSKDNMQTYSAQVQIFNDDLRWGRLDSEYSRPAFLIYPQELRFQEWYDVVKRNSYNLNLNFSQIVDKRNVIGLLGAISFQDGLLATPFHRIYFSDGTLAVEQFPKKRIKGSIGFKWNRFIKGNFILKNSISGYADDFDILGFAFENETALKLNPKWTVFSNLRYYQQSASKYFAPYLEHDSNDRFYTSDYDLSKFNSFKIGFGAKFSPFSYSSDSKRFDTATLSYNYYNRSNSLSAHMVSLAIKYSRFKTKRIKRSK